MKKVTIVQARMSSTRFPGKVLKDILGKPLLIRMVERLQMSKLCGKVIVAISDNPNDDLLAELLKENQIPFFRGNENDLLERHYLCAKEEKADIVSKIPSDCPLICPKVIDKVFLAFENGTYDYYSNLHPATYPDGNDVEIFTFSALEKAYKEAKKPLEREHTTPYFWENLNLFKIGNYAWESGKDFSMSHRFTIDYKEDYDFIKCVYEALYPQKNHFELEDILNLLESRPDIFEINQNYAGVNWYRNHLDELTTIAPNQTKKI